MVNNYAPPAANEIEIARGALEKLSLAPHGDDGRKYYIYDAQSEVPIDLPEGAVALLRDVLAFMALGHGITLFPRMAEVTTVEAANILNVSRPYVIKLLEEGQLPFRTVGSHRRIPLRDLLAYKDESDRSMDEAMNELVALSQELGLYDL